jgi:hypothetical protein
MSIYPVKINRWYLCGEWRDEGEFLKSLLPSIRCETCGKQVTWRGWVMHSITFGGPCEAWCSKKCLEEWRRPQ